MLKNCSVTTLDFHLPWKRVQRGAIVSDALEKPLRKYSDKEEPVVHADETGSD